MIHLHVHSHYSLLDGIIPIKKLVAHAQKLCMKSIALTDHGSIAGWVEFQIECNKIGIKPIFGIEAYCCTSIEDKKTYHLTLLAKNNEGLKEIIGLHNIATLEQIYYKPRMTYNQILECSNIIVLSGCLGSYLSQHLLSSDFEKADEWVYSFRDHFKEDFYIEEQDLGIADLTAVHAKLYRYKIQRAVTNDVHYLEKADSEAHHMFMAGQFHKKADELDRMPSEMWLKTTHKYPTATTYEIDDKCNTTIVKYAKTLPKPPEPIFTDRMTEDRKSRVRAEYDVINKAGYFDYFCVVADYLQWAREHDIQIGPSRGSVGGSELAYVMGIHDLDPQKYHLYFSRFYNEGRKDSMPDIDNDFPQSGIEAVKKYIGSKHNIAGMAIYGSMGVKGALKFAARVSGMPFQRSNELSKQFSIYTSENMPTTGYGDEMNACLRLAKQYIGLFDKFGQHASGYIITDIDIKKEIPLRYSKNGEIQTCWDMNHLEWLGFVKFDLLKIKTLDIIQECDVTVDYNNEQTYDLISSGRNVGIFQLSGSVGISELATQIKPRTIEDIAVILAIYRPGPLQNKVHSEYVACRNGQEPTYLHPFLEKVLGDTYGKILYQEQVIKICMAVGFDEVEADTIRKMMGKKKPELLKELEPRFITKCSGITGRHTAKKIWDEICNCSGYLFGLSHAIGYATLSYITAYLKTNHPLKFYTALLNNENEPQKLQEIISDTNITILPPRYNKSKMNFTIEGDYIRYGLKGIYSIGEKDSQKILEQGQKLLNRDSVLSQTLVRGGFFDDINSNRKQLFSLLTTKRKRTLFEIKDYTDIQKSKYEFEMLRVFLDDNPLKDYDIISYTSNDLKDSVEILAIVQNVTISKNKKGNQYAKVDIINCNNMVHKLYIFSKQFDEIKLTVNGHYLLLIRQYEDIFYIKGARQL